MQGIILAAGAGTRLRGAAGDNPKCLVRIGDRTLLERQIAGFRACGVDDVAVVAGFKADRVAAVCGRAAATIENSRYAETNSLYSLWLAGPLLTRGFVVVNGDVLFHQQLLEDLLGARHEDALLVDCRARSPLAFGAEEMKVKIRGGCVADMGKALGWRHADGENVGLVKFGPAGARLLARCLDDLVSGGAIRDWAPSAFRQFARLRPLHAIGTRGYPWIEIDFPEDYERACSHVLPLIDAVEAGSEAPGSSSPAEADAADGLEWRPATGHV